MESDDTRLLSEIAANRDSIHLSCPGCGRKVITEGLFYYKQFGDMTFERFLARLRCRVVGCGRRGMQGRIEPKPKRTYLSSVDYLEK